MAGHPRHGHRPTGRPSPTYTSWAGMLRRCRNTQYPRYDRYGGRGIQVCVRWHTFENFLADMGERPVGKSLDRWPDNDGNYEPGNCRWATQREQMESTSRSVQLTINGATQALSVWSAQHGVNRYTIKSRLARGWSVERAITTPPARCGRGA